MIKDKAFTFIELIVSVSIILVLTTVALVSYQATNRKSRDNKRKADLEQVRSALEMYRSDNDAYPITSTWSTLMTALSTYINQAPSDPKGYSYYYSSSAGTTYDLCAYFESSPPNNCGTTSCGTVTCNYKLTNP